MSAHNHDEEIIKQRFGNTKTGNGLQKKVDDKNDNALRTAILQTDISGLSRDEAKQRLKTVIDNLFDK